MLPAIGRARAMRGAVPLLRLPLRRALGTTIDVRPSSVTEGEPRPISIPSPSPSTDEQQQASSSSGSSAEAKGWGLFPSDIVEHLDRFVVGQEEAKKVKAARFVSCAICICLSQPTHKSHTTHRPRPSPCGPGGGAVSWLRTSGRRWRRRTCSSRAPRARARRRLPGACRRWPTRPSSRWRQRGTRRRGKWWGSADGSDFFLFKLALLLTALPPDPPPDPPKPASSGRTRPT